MKKIQYQVLRFLPDRVSGEFVNVGVVAYDQDVRILLGKFIDKAGTINNLFPSINGRHLIKSIKLINNKVNQMAVRLKDEFHFSTISSIDEVTSAILPNDDSSLYFSEIKFALDINVDSCAEYFYTRCVLKHEASEGDDLHSDKEVWTKIYKQHFDKEGITKKLHHSTVRTLNDTLEFDKSWKNGVWNIFEPVAFNLSRPDSVKNKVYKWVGKIDELKTSKEEAHVYLLSVLPENKELCQFVTNKLKNISTQNTQVHLVFESDIPSLTYKIKKAIEKHEKEKQ